MHVVTVCPSVESIAYHDIDAGPSPRWYDLDEEALIGDDRNFEKMCRVIALTERRGYRQLETLLRDRLQSNAVERARQAGNTCTQNAATRAEWRL